MRNVVSILVLIIIFAFAGCDTVNIGVEPKTSVTSYEEKIFEIKGAPVLYFTGDSAKVEVYAWEKQTLKFEIKKRIIGIGSKESLGKKLDKISVGIIKKEGVCYFTTKYNGVIPNVTDIGTDVNVFFPRERVKLDLRLEKGLVKILDDFKGIINMELNTVDVNIKRFDGTLKINVNRGNITIEGGSLEKGSGIKTGVGHIWMKTSIEQPGYYTFETGIGNLEIELPSTNRFSLETVGLLQSNEFETDPSSPVKIGVKTGIGYILLAKHRD